MSTLSKYISDNIREYFPDADSVLVDVDDKTETITAEVVYYPAGRIEAVGLQCEIGSDDDWFVFRRLPLDPHDTSLTLTIPLMPDDYGVEDEVVDADAPDEISQDEFTVRLNDEVAEWLTDGFDDVSQRIADSKIGLNKIEESINTIRRDDKMLVITDKWGKLHCFRFKLERI